ncbi:class II aldolase/adducin family protein [bacterium]|nr:class II aldolase/adducin family protein [bacterium]
MFENIKSEIIKFGHFAGLKGLTSGLSGNISCRQGDNIVITSTGTANGYLGNEDFSIIDFDGNLVEGSKKASSEKFLHIEYYNQRPEINSVFHVHPPYLTALAASGTALEDDILPEIVFHFGKIPLADYALPGSKELVVNTSKFFKEFDVVLMANHGVIVAGKNIKDAYLKLELCESYAKTLTFAKLFGGAKILSQENVKEIYTLKEGINSGNNIRK